MREESMLVLMLGLVTRPSPYTPRPHQLTANDGTGGDNFDGRKTNFNAKPYPLEIRSYLLGELTVEVEWATTVSEAGELECANVEHAAGEVGQAGFGIEGDGEHDERAGVKV
jgi:hypothetical protein